MARKKFLGKYRGTVLNAVDPMQIGRIQVDVPDVSATAAGVWAMPCVPVAGPQSGMVMVPPVGANVWVEFERGDPSLPIWTGCFWPDVSERPPRAALAPPGVTTFGVHSALGHSVEIVDVPGPEGGLLLRSASGATIRLNETGIHLDNGMGATITLQGPTVHVNGDALVVT